MIHDYKELIAWQRAMDLCVEVYSLTREFPSDERFGAVLQCRRSAVSVPSNIAEGQGRRSAADFGRFLHIANGSRQELETQIILAVRLEFITEDQACDVLDRVSELGRILSGLSNSLQ